MLANPPPDGGGKPSPTAGNPPEDNKAPTSGDAPKPASTAGGPNPTVAGAAPITPEDAGTPVGTAAGEEGTGMHSDGADSTPVTNAPTGDVQTQGNGSHQFHGAQSPSWLTPDEWKDTRHTFGKFA